MSDISTTKCSKLRWIDLKGSLGAVVKLLPCDHEVTGSSLGNSLLQKCRERLRTIDPKWSDPSPDPAQAGATCTGLPFFFMCKVSAFVTIIDPCSCDFAGNNCGILATR